MSGKDGALDLLSKTRKESRRGGGGERKGEEKGGEGREGRGRKGE